MKKIFLILFLCLALCSCSNETKVKEIINEKYIEKIVLEKDYIIIDVRSIEEYNELHIKNSINIPYNEISEETKLDKDKIIFVYCKSGNRSKEAYNVLSKLGYTVYNLGGINDIVLPRESNNEKNN